MKERIKELISTLPHSSGVYLMYDQNGGIIYIGKAKDLYKRVSQYFLRPQEGKVLAMVSKVEYFEFIITKNEKEAFILEMNLVHEHLPRYNILLKDDKHYPYIALKKKGDPYLKIARNNKDPNYYYFGPYPSSKYAYQIIDLLNYIFPLRKCKNIPSEPCLYYHLNQCLAPCINEVKNEAFETISLQIRTFLSGKDSAIYNEYKEKMIKASEVLDFEKANEYKNILKSITHIKERQNVENFDQVNRDYFSYAIRENYLAISLLTYRDGLLLGKDNFVVERFGEEKEQIIELILQYYRSRDLPSEIVINLEGAKEEIEEIFDVKVVSSSKGKLFDILEIAKLNAIQTLDNYFQSTSLNEDKLKLLEELGDILQIKTPFHIELFDNSHLQGDASIGVMVAFINGEPSKKMYRKFNIEGDEKRDDYSSMEEITYRRYKRVIDNKDKIPDLILVDGGEKQVRSCVASLQKLNIDIPCFGLVKNDKHQTRGVVDKNGKVYPLENRKLFFFLVRMQDEVHRYAITFHRYKRNKEYKSSVYSNIKGLGMKRIALLNSTFRSIDELKSASLEDLSQLLPSDIAKALYERIKEIE